MSDWRYEIRAEIRRNRLMNYQVAMQMGISISNFYIKLQRPVDDEASKPFFEAIEALAAERKAGLRGGK